MTDPSDPLGSICNKRSFLHLYQGVSVISSMWYVKVRFVRYPFDTCACVPFRKTRLEVQNDKSSFSLLLVMYLHKIQCIFVCVFSEQKKWAVVWSCYELKFVPFFYFVVTKDSKEKAVLSKAKKWNGD